MHPLHNYIANQIAEKLKERHIVVMYDKRKELVPFFDEIMEGSSADGGLQIVEFGPRTAKVVRFDGSFLMIRSVVEPVTGGDSAEDVVIYLPGVDPDDKASLLMELAKAGIYYRQQALKQMARNVLRKRLVDVAIDEMLRPETLSYADLARMTADTESTDGVSLLKGIYNTSDTLAILTSWLADESHDLKIIEKEAVPELLKVVSARIGIDLPQDAALPRLRASVARNVLASDFRLDIEGDIPPGLKSVAALPLKEHETAIQEIAKRLRERHAAAYETMADRVERELGLDAASVAGTFLGGTDTFRFEERAVVQDCFKMIAAERFEDVLAILAARGQSFWDDRDPVRKAVWEVCRLMVEVGNLSNAAKVTIAKANGKPGQRVERYTAPGPEGWFRLDRAQRQLETLVTSLDENDLDEGALAKTRAIYDDAARRMAEGFIKVLGQAGWTIPGVLHQTRIWSDIVGTQPKPVAIVVVDAMRYEIGTDLVARLQGKGEVSLIPAIAALPSITPVGMAALLPGPQPASRLLRNQESSAP